MFAISPLARARHVVSLALSLFFVPATWTAAARADAPPRPDATKGDQDAPKADRDGPKADRVAPKADRVAPKADRIEPKADRIEPKADRVAPKADREPKADQVAPRADRVTSKPEHVEAKADRVASKADRTGSATEQDPPKADGKPARDSTHRRTARIEKSERSEPRTCAKPAVEIVAGADHASFSLSRCDGSPAPLAIEHLSVLARPSSVAKPSEPLESLAKTKSPDISPGIRRVDAGLVARLERVVDHFRKPGDMSPPKVLLVSGVRPKSAGSYHQSGRALDFRLDGISNEDLVAFCKTLEDTGCGYYPHSSFVHMDVRARGAGHVSWIDISSPGEAPHYVTAWPLPADGASKLPALPSTDSRDESAKRRGHVNFY